MENSKILKKPEKFSTERGFFKQNQDFFVENHVETVESLLFSGFEESSLFLGEYFAPKGSRKGAAGSGFSLLWKQRVRYLGEVLQ